jgi:hypothetical protein
VSGWSRVFDLCFADGIPGRSLRVALIVGTILNLVNQGDVFLHGGHVNLFKVALTYTVPYIVATYGAVSFRLHTRTSGDRAA